MRERGWDGLSAWGGEVGDRELGGELLGQVERLGVGLAVVAEDFRGLGQWACGQGSCGEPESALDQLRRSTSAFLCVLVLGVQ